jgi:hypothetical protein
VAVRGRLACDAQWDGARGGTITSLQRERSRAARPLRTHPHPDG